MNQCLEGLPKRWFETQKKRLREGRINALIKDLNNYLEPNELSDEEAPVQRALRYLQNRLDALDYKQAFAENLPDRFRTD